MREARGCIELQAKLLGELSDRPQVNVLISPQWIGLRDAIFVALEAFPDARARVADELLELEAES